MSLAGAIFRMLSNISDEVKTVSFIGRKAPSQIFNRVLNTSPFVGHGSVHDNFHYQTFQPTTENCVLFTVKASRGVSRGVFHVSRAVFRTLSNS